MSYPSDYQPSAKDPIPFYKSRGPTADGSIYQFYVQNGFTYVAPLLSIPQPWRENATDITFLWGMTQSPEIDNKADILKLFPSGLRGVRPGFAEEYDVYYFASESLPDSSLTSLRNLKGVTYVVKNDEVRMELERIQVTGYYGTPWPVEGVSAMSAFMTSYYSELAKRGATIDAFITDKEFINFGDDTRATRLAGITGSTQYFEIYNGLSSWHDLLNSYGISASQVLTTGNQPYLDYKANWAWAMVASRYVGYSNYLGYYRDINEKINPKLLSANYNSYLGENIRENAAKNEDGRIWPQGGNHGNAGSPLVYGAVRQLAADYGNYGNVITQDDPTKLRFSISERNNGLNGPLVLRSPSLSFMLSMMELRTAKRNDYNNALIPHISTIYSYAYTEVFMLAGNNFTIGEGQSPAEVLHDHWYPVNISGTIYSIGGITSYDGTTTAYLIKPSIPLVSESWYKQNIASITFDGSTSAYQINSIGITGTTSALAYYLNGVLTSGNTYVLSYFIDTTRGFTGFNARFITWNASDNIGLAPSLTTTSGITFQQILPVTGAISYLQSPIQYGTGDSGWIKVAFEFVYSSSTPRLGFNIYHAENNTIQGYTAFIKDVYLNHKLNGQTRSLAFIGNKDKNSSIEYYYKGITAGLTYIFSYYTDLSRSYTGPDVIQTFNHFQQPTYYLPLGITYEQTAPVIQNSLFHTAGISYGSGTGWTQISYKFNIPIGDTYDPISRDTLAVSVYKFNNSALDANDGLSGACMYIASPTLEIENTPSNILIPIVPINYESITTWSYGPPHGWSELKLGPNRRYNTYMVERGGNSAYFAEFIYHCCLNGSAKFAVFNALDYLDFGLTGSISDGNANNLFGNKRALYLQSGLTHHITSMKTLDNLLADVHSRLGGFTTSSADVSRPNFLAPYIASGAPGPNGLTWWWRVTALPGYTVYCNGITLNSNATIGTWIGTTGPTLAGINLSYSKWTQVKPEPSIAPPTKEINFSGMTLLSQLTDSGFTFSRGSTATYTDSTGKIVVVGPNIPRFDHDPNTLQPIGLLIEGSKTNLLNWSETFASTGGSNNNWNDNNLSRSTGFTSPSGITNAIRFTATGSNATLISSLPIGSVSTRTFSIFMRGISGTENISYTLDGGTSWNPITGITSYITDAAGLTIETIKPIDPNISTMWKRFMFGPTSANHHVGIKLGNTGDIIEMWGAQVESRLGFGLINFDKASSYIPTLSSTVSRSADSCYITGISFDSWYGQTYGTFVVKCRNVEQARPIDLSKDSNNDMGFALGQNSISLYGKIGGQSVQRSLPGFNLYHTQRVLPNIDYKFTFTYGKRGMKVAEYGIYEGGSPPEGTRYMRSLNWPGNTLGPPQITRLTLNGSTDKLHIQNIRYWPFVFDENTINEMAKGGVDPVGLFGVYG